MEKVEVTHPELPGVRRNVSKVAFEHHLARSGWTLADAPDERESTRQALLAAGVEPEEAARVADAAYPQEPPGGGGETSKAPAESGASSSEDNAEGKPPRVRRASSKEGE